MIEVMAEGAQVNSLGRRDVITRLGPHAFLWKQQRVIDNVAERESQTAEVEV